MSEYAIEIQQLKKTYKGKSGEKEALKGIDLSIPTGSIFGLLGPNGAGKSTTINILSGLVNKTSGQVKIWGFDQDENSRNAKSNIGVVPQELIFDAFFTPREVLELQAGLYGVPKSQRRTVELLKAVHLFDKADAYARTLSGGMRRRLLIAKAMVHNPPILVLDEPTAGVDIELRQLLWAYVRELNEQGVTVVLTTHYLEEAEELCDHIAIINHGELVCNEPTPKLLQRINEKELLIKLQENITELPASLQAMGMALKQPGHLSIKTSQGDGKTGLYLNALMNAGYQIEDISSHETDLEDIFLQLTRGAHESEITRSTS